MHNLILTNVIYNSLQKSLGLVVNYLAQDPKFVKILARTLYDFQDEIVASAHDSGMQRPRSKKNSELLNSLLGLPKNILKSG